MIAIRYAAARRAVHEVGTRALVPTATVAADGLVAGEHAIRDAKCGPTLVEDGAAVGHADDDRAASNPAAVPANRSIAGERAAGDRCRCLIPDGAALAETAVPADGLIADEATRD